MLHKFFVACSNVTIALVLAFIARWPQRRIRAGTYARRPFTVKKNPVLFLCCEDKYLTSTHNQGRDFCKVSFYCEEKTPTYFSAVRTEISLFFLQFRWSGSEVENAFELHIFLLNISNVPVKEKLLQLRDKLLHITLWTNTQQIYINNRH